MTNYALESQFGGPLNVRFRIIDNRGYGVSGDLAAWHPVLQSLVPAYFRLALYQHESRRITGHSRTYMSRGFFAPITRCQFCQLSSRAAPASTSSTHARSEEQTSELTSQMRISYAVLCLKKKKK